MIKANYISHENYLINKKKEVCHIYNNKIKHK